jgi:hypothetical protein
MKVELNFFIYNVMALLFFLTALIFNILVYLFRSY